MSALYELTADFKAVATRLEEMEMDADTIRDTLDGYSADFDNKVVAIASLIRNLEETADSIRAAEVMMGSRRNAMQKKAEWLREYVINNMKAIGKNEINCPLFSVKVRTNRPSVIVEDNAFIPLKYRIEKNVVTPDKKALLQALESGEQLEGITLVCSNSLSIK